MVSQVTDDDSQVPLVLVVFARCRERGGDRHADRSVCRRRRIDYRAALSTLCQTVRDFLRYDNDTVRYAVMLYALIPLTGRRVIKLTKRRVRVL